jgi:tetratricopeptide (TPR) repeat protein
LKAAAAFILPLLIFAPVPSAGQDDAAECLALVRQGRYGEAKPILEQAVKSEPNNAAAQYALGLIHLNSDRDFEKAAACFERAVALDDKNAEYHYQLGVAYGRLALAAGKLRQVGLAAKVKRQGLKAIALDPRHIEARNGMIQFYLSAPGLMGGSREKAREQAAEVSRIDPYQGELSWAIIASHDRDSAELEKRYKAALALNPVGWQALQSYGSFCLRRNRPDEALAVFNRLAALRPDDPRSHEALGDALLAKGREPDALQSYGRALSLRPDYDSGSMSAKGIRPWPRITTPATWRLFKPDGGRTKPAPG